MARTQTTTSKGKATATAVKPKPASSQSVLPNILCAVDGTRSGLAAVRMAANLAAPNGHLTFLTVTAEGTSGGINRAAAISPSRVEGVLRRAKRIADEVGVESSGEVSHEGPAVKVLLQRARDHDLLAIGAPPTSWLGGMLVGGVAATALSQFTTPMLVVRRTFAGALQGREILVASDGEKGSDQIVKLAARLGLSLGAKVTLVNALGAESKMNPRSIQAQARVLERMLPGDSEVLIEPGKPWDVIIKAANSHKAAIVVMGSRRLSGLRALGSVSRRVAHDAPCSVLLLPPNAKK
jgi:nucleotide-binding universal stress UspA family protein